MVEDDTLIFRAQSGDEQAFVDLMRAYHAFVYAIVIGMVNNSHDAEDIVQEVFIKTYRRLSQLEDTTKFKSWLAEVARNCARNWQRTQRTDTVSINDVSEGTLQAADSPGEQLVRDEELEMIRRAMNTLSQKDRDIARSYYLDGASYDDLIRAHGLSYKAISFRLSRAKRTLAKRLQYLLNAAFVPPVISLKKISSGGLTAMKSGKMSGDKQQQDLAAQIKEYHQIGEFDKALEISAGALESNPVDLDAYRSRWELVADMFPEEEAKGMIRPEIESLLQANDETQELLNTAYWGYRGLAGGADNVPTVLLDKMLQYPGTKVYQSALFGLAHQSPDTRQKWHYYLRLIDECSASDIPGWGWYLLGHEHLLWLAEDDRSLASDDILDHILDRFLDAFLSYCQDTQQWFGWAFTEAVKWRLKLNIRLDRGLEILERAKARLGEEEEQEWMKDFDISLKEAHKFIVRLRSEIYLRQERWRESYDGLAANAPDSLESLARRFGYSSFQESIPHYFYMVGRSAEGIGEWERAKRYYADAHFAPTPHTEGRAGLERIYHQMERGTTDTFEAFLRNTETEYRIREDTDREEIRQKVVMNRLNKKATDFSLETLEGETYALSAACGRVVLLDVGASWCGPCNMMIPEVKLVYERFSKFDDVAIWGINSGETPEDVQKFLEEHQPLWPILLDRRKEVGKAYGIKGIPFFILIDKEGNWQYSFSGANLIKGQPLIWMIEALRED